MASIKTPSIKIESESKSSHVIEKIRELMYLLDIKQKDLSSNLNIKPSQVSHYFNHRCELKANNLLSILELVGINVEDLLTEKINSFKQSGSYHSKDLTCYAKLGRIREPKKESLLRIIKMLGD